MWRAQVVLSAPMNHSPDPAVLEAIVPGRTAPRFQAAARGALALVLVLLGLWTLLGFLRALVWAVVFAIVLWPLYRRAEQRWPPGRHNLLLPLLFTLGVALVFLVPLFLLGAQLGREAHGFILWVHGAQTNGIPMPAAVQGLPFGRQEVTSWWQANLADPGQASAMLARVNRDAVLAMSTHFGSQLLHRVTVFVFTLLTLFFLFRDGRTVMAQLRRAGARAFGPSGERVAAQVTASVHGTVNGLVLVGIGEGVILGIAYILVGVPHPTIFGVFTAIAAIIPFGAPVAFCVAAALLAAQGSVASAAVVVGVGTVVVFVADHFIRPALIGGATKLPFIWVLLGLLGGIEAWGLLGLFIGPAIMAALILLWREWTSPAATPDGMLLLNR